MKAMRDTLVLLNPSIVEVDDPAQKRNAVAKLRMAAQAIFGTAINNAVLAYIGEQAGSQQDESLRMQAVMVHQAVQKGVMKEVLQMVMTDAMKTLDDAFFLKIQQYLNCFTDVLFNSA